MDPLDILFNYIVPCAAVICFGRWAMPRSPAQLADIVSLARERRDRALGLDFKRELRLRRQDMTELLQWFYKFRI